MQRHRSHRLTGRRQPVHVRHQELTVGPVVDDRAVEHPAERPEDLVDEGGRRPFDGVDAEHARRGHRALHPPPAAERARVEKCPENGGRIGRDFQGVIDGGHWRGARRLDDPPTRSLYYWLDRCFEHSEFPRSARESRSSALRAPRRARLCPEPSTSHDTHTTRRPASPSRLFFARRAEVGRSDTRLGDGSQPGDSSSHGSETRWHHRMAGHGRIGAPRAHARRARFRSRRAGLLLHLAGRAPPGPTSATARRRCSTPTT